MSPRMEADFSWTEDVQATTPVYDKGDYELTVKSIRGSAWEKRDENGNPTGEVTKVIRIRPEMVGVYDSKGKIKFELNGKEIKGADAEELDLWVHTKGGREQAKRIMMAIQGFNPREPEEEQKFNEFLRDSQADLGYRAEEREDGEGLTLKIGEGWEKLFVGKNFRAHLDKEIYQPEGRAPVEQQNYVSISPVN